MAIRYAEARIAPCSSGFGEYQVQEPGDTWDDLGDLMDEMRSGCNITGERLLLLGYESLPEGIEDIRGRIHNEPPRVYAIVGSNDGELYT